MTARIAALADERRAALGGRHGKAKRPPEPVMVLVGVLSRGAPARYRMARRIALLGFAGAAASAEGASAPKATTDRRVAATIVVVRRILLICSP